MNKVLILFLTLATQFLYGQEKKNQYGICINFLRSSNKLGTYEGTTFDRIKNVNRLGFELGFTLRHISNDRLEFRLNPLMGYEEHKITYERQNSVENLLFKPSYLRLPFHMILKLTNKYPIGIITGFTPSAKVQNSTYDPLDKLNLNRYDFSVDLGLNYSIKFKLFTLCPEFRFSKSLINAAGDNRTEYGQGLATYYRDKFTFGLYFY